MKKLLVLLAVTLGVFCFGSAALAEGITVYGEYDLLSVDEWNQDLTALTLGGEYDMDPFLIGGSYSFALSYDPEPLPGEEMSDSILALYGGYKLLDSDTFRIYGLGGYYVWSDVYDDGFEKDEIKTTSIAIGAKGIFSLDPLTVTATVMFGVSNEFAMYIDDVEFGSIDDVDCTVFEVKGLYQFTDELSAFAAYRSYKVSDSSGDITLSGFGVGVQYAF